jgi:hypothetical protein
MKPFNLIKKKCKTQKEQLEVCEALINYFVGDSEVLWAISCTKKEKIGKSKKCSKKA